MAAWQIWALSSAVFAALTAIFAKIGVEHVSPDVATFIRTVVVLLALAALVGATRQFPDVAKTSARSYFYLVLSGLAAYVHRTILDPSKIRSAAPPNTPSLSTPPYQPPAPGAI